ncbi:SpoIIE family protein phosphatase [Candidatus Latescibacterota bacterium]
MIPRSAPRFALPALLLLLTALPAATHNGAVATAVPVEGITVDGELGDWPTTVHWHPIENWYAGGPGRGADDFSARVAFAHDPARRQLLVAVDIRDDRPDSTADLPREGALLSLRRHLDDDALPEPLDPVLHFDGTPVRGEGASRDHTVAARRREDGYRYEWRIDVGAEIGAAPSGRAPVVGVGVQVADREGAESTRLSWGLFGDDGDVILAAPQQVGRLRLRVESAATGAGISGVDLSLRSPAGRDPGLTARTAIDGEVELDVPAGVYRVEAAPAWTEAVDAQVTVRAGATAEMTLSLSAPQVTTRAAGRGRGVWQRLSVTEGLGGLCVYDVLQDRRGDLWLAMEGGLSRYDGTTVTTYTVADGLPSYWVSTLYEDSRGIIWAGTGDDVWTSGQGGVAWFGARGALSLPEPLAGIEDDVSAIAEDTAGRVWLAGRRLRRWDGTRLVDLTERLDPAPVRLHSALIDRQGRLWVAGEAGTDGDILVGTEMSSGGIWRVESGRTVSYHPTPHPVWSLAEDLQAGLWVGTGQWAQPHTEGQILRLRDTLEVVPRTWTLSGAAKDIVVTPKGDVWFAVMGAAGGVLHFDGRKFEEFGAADGIGKHGASAVAVDREGALWVGTGFFASGSGALRFDHDRLVSYSMADGIADDRVGDVAEDSEGHLWLAGRRTLTQYDGVRFASVRLVSEARGQDAPNLVIDGQDRVWVPAYNQGWHRGLRGYDGTAVQQIDRTRNSDLSEITGRDATADWRGQGFAQSSRQAPLDSLGARGHLLRHVFTSTNGTLWAGAYFGGVYGFTGDKEVRLTRRNGLADDHVNRIFEDADGNLWIASGFGGVSRFDGERIVQTLTVNDGLGANWVSDINQTRDGRMLFGTLGGGLSLYDGLVVQTLNDEDGLSDNTVNRVIEDSRGDIWVGTSHGVTRYRPRRTPPLVHITRVVTHRSIDDPEEVSVPSTQDVVAVYFEGRTLKAMGRDLAYVYRLLGHEDGWRTTRDGTVVYEDLPLGSYTFEVKAVSQDLDYSEAAAMELRVVPPYARLTLQVGLALSLAGLVLAASYGLRRRRDQRRAEQALMRDMEEELQAAHDMQMGLMPTGSPDLEGISIAGSCTPANDVGGDFYQYFESEGGWSASLADVTGHSMEAAIPAVMFSGVLDKQMEFPSGLEERFASLNRSLCRSLGEHTFVCLSMVDVDPAAGTMRLSNCGCPYPLHYLAGTGEIAEIQVDSYPLGVRPDTEYRATQISYGEGDYFVLHSDGFPEATNAEMETFGFDRTMEVIRQGCSEGLAPEYLIERLIGEVKAFTGDVPQADDMTCVVIKVER